MGISGSKKNSESESFENGIIEHVCPNKKCKCKNCKCNDCKCGIQESHQSTESSGHLKCECGCKSGINGKDGKDGVNGKDGKDGINGKDGKDGINGKDGKDGKDGINGKDGKDGVDASIEDLGLPPAPNYPYPENCDTCEIIKDEKGSSVICPKLPDKYFVLCLRADGSKEWIELELTSL